MPTVLLTKSIVDSLPPKDRTYIVFDADLTGFGLRIMPSGSKSWIVEYRPHGGGRGVTKRRVTLGKATKLAPDAARKAARRLLAGVTLGADPAAALAEQRAAMTVADLIDAFKKEHVSGKLKAATGENYAASLAILEHAHGSLKAAALTRAQLATLHARRRETPYAANRALAVWSKMYSWAGKRGLVTEGFNPARGIERYREQGRERYLTTAELAALGDALREAETIGLPWQVDETKPKARHLAAEANRRTKLDEYAVAAVRLLILTGARLREILDLKWADVDFERGVAFLPDSKTGRKPIYLSAAALAILAGLPRMKGNDHCIVGEGEGGARSDLKKPWRALSRRAGLDGIRIHDLRHSFASVGAGAGMGLPIVGKLLGHSQPATTARYAHLDSDPLRRAANTIGATISAAMSGAPRTGTIKRLRAKGGAR